jgi:concentrative nucleoside transporter, CNT family
MIMILSTASAVPAGTWSERGQSLLGLFVFLFIAFLIGRLRGARSIPLRIVIWGLILQFAAGLLVLFSPGLLARMQDGIKKLSDYANEGAKMVFGELVNFVIPVDGGAGVVKVAAVFAFSVLPMIVFVSMLTAILYHIGVLTLIVRAMAWVMQKTMGTSGAETLSTAANIFVGQTEAPLIVRPFLERATQSELMAIMVGGFANIATGVLALYAGWLDPYVAGVGGHLAVACLISAPATLVVAKLMMPETESSNTSGLARIKVETTDANLLDAATRGTTEGMTLAFNVGAMLIAFTALIALINGLIGAGFGADWTLQRLLGYVGAPLAWLVGVPWDEAYRAGSLMGTKTVLNELLAYSAMRDAFQADPQYLSPRAALLTTYALCGFANFASIGIQIGGISVLAPSRRADLSRIGLLAMIGGTIATLMTACVVGILV